MRMGCLSMPCLICVKGRIYAQIAHNGACSHLVTWWKMMSIWLHAQIDTCAGKVVEHLWWCGWTLRFNHLCPEYFILALFPTPDLPSSTHLWYYAEIGEGCMSKPIEEYTHSSHPRECRLPHRAALQSGVSLLFPFSASVTCFAQIPFVAI